MRLETRPFDPSDPRNQQHLPRIIELSHEEAMIPITDESIQGHRLARIMVDLDSLTERFAGYAAITQVYSPGVVELGALVTDEGYRGRGVASRLVREVRREAHEAWGGAQILTFTNEASKQVFAKLGGLVVESPDSLPAEVWKVCRDCTSYERCVVQLGQQCCGRVLDITEI